MAREVELLYFEGCPSWEKGLDSLRAALLAEHVDANVATVKVQNDLQAQQLRFLGSPSFRLDGQELWPERWRQYSLSCRVYSTSEGLRGFPTVAMLREALRKAARSEPLHRPAPSLGE